MIKHIPLNKSNRMVRDGIGKHEGRWFGRVDLWWAGFRFTGWALPLYIVPHVLFLYWLVSS